MLGCLALAAFAVRLRGHYLAIASLGFAVITYQVLINWEKVTEGVRGIYGILPPVASTTGLFYLVAGIALAVYVLLDNLVRSPVGDTLRAIREDEVSAASLGVNGAAGRAGHLPQYRSHQRGRNQHPAGRAERPLRARDREPRLRVLQTGSIIASGPCAVLKQDERVKEAYLGRR